MHENEVANTPETAAFDSVNLQKLKGFAFEYQKSKNPSGLPDSEIDKALSHFGVSSSSITHGLSQRDGQWLLTRMEADRRRLESENVSPYTWNWFHDVVIPVNLEVSCQAAVEDTKRFSIVKNQLIPQLQSTPVGREMEDLDKLFQLAALRKLALLGGVMFVQDCAQATGLPYRENRGELGRYIGELAVALASPRLLNRTEGPRLYKSYWEIVDELEKEDDAMCNKKEFRNFRREYHALPTLIGDYKDNALEKIQIVFSKESFGRLHATREETEKLFDALFPYFLIS